MRQIFEDRKKEDKDRQKEDKNRKKEEKDSRENKERKINFNGKRERTIDKGDRKEDKR
jgi:hypothetical protein